MQRPSQPLNREEASGVASSGVRLVDQIKPFPQSQEIMGRS